ncbi:MAG: hypothetical protein KDD45_12130, partial [Bdellovibrionales bacterium]|nr:hypothetical protein [Bdellovibrionales bacterium]
MNSRIDKLYKYLFGFLIISCTTLSAVTDLQSAIAERTTCFESHKIPVEKDNNGRTVGGGVDPAWEKTCNSQFQINIQSILRAKKCKPSTAISDTDECESLKDAIEGETRDDKKNKLIKDTCDNYYEEYKDTFRDCRSAYENMSEKCNMNDDDELIDNDTLNKASPFIRMIGGADVMLETYTAMNDKPGCYMSRSEFTDEKRDLNDEVKELEQKIKENTDDAQKAQEDFADKLKEWADQEKEISDRLTEIPLEKDKNLNKLNKEKLNAKTEAEAKYNAIVDQLLELKSKYNDLVAAQAVALEDSSEFAMHDKCLQSVEKIKSTKNQNTPPNTTASSFRGA